MTSMDDTPAPAGFKKVTEGKATILFPDTNEVFYNPIQEFNRDLSIAAIRTWDEINQERFQERAAQKKVRREAAEARKAEKEGEAYVAPPPEGPASPRRGVTILEALSASGLRSVRYAKEIPNVHHILTNDLGEDAVISIKRNADFNGISPDLLTPNKGDAIDVLYQHRDPSKQYDVIDLDPYGTASPFIDGAVQAVVDGGLLCVTCTDLAVLAGTNYTETCFAKYGGLPLKADFCHEMALRLVLNTLQVSAARYKRYIEPLVSLSIDYYLRVFVRVHTSPMEVKNTASKTSMVYCCTGCHSFYSTPLGKVTVNDKGNKKYGVNTGPPVDGKCEFCGFRFHVGGPTWGTALHNHEFIDRMLKHVSESEDSYKTKPRIMGMLTLCREELETPFYYTAHSLSGTLHCTNMPLLVLHSAILNKGYKVSGSHAAQSSIKTDAPPSVMWDIMRCHIKAHPVKAENIKAGSPAHAILAKEPSFIADFTMNKAAHADSRKLVRYQANPEKNWGPQAKANKRKGEAPEAESTAGKTNKHRKQEKKDKKEQHMAANGATKAETNKQETAADDSKDAKPSTSAE